MWPFRRSRAEPATSEPDLRLVVGLGNPGGQHARTRHNVGYMVANELARRAGVSFRSSKQRAEVARGAIEGIPLLLALPITYMNDSGQAVSRLVSYYRIPVENLVVICDELDLPFGTLRLRPSGSAGGHNGLRSIIEALGTEEFVRLRVGVGRPRDDAIQHVLSPFPPEEERLVPGLVSVAADAVIAALREGIRPAMNEYNRNWLRELERST